MIAERRGPTERATFGRLGHDEAPKIRRRGSSCATATPRHIAVMSNCQRACGYAHEYGPNRPPRPIFDKRLAKPDSAEHERTTPGSTVAEGAAKFTTEAWKISGRAFLPLVARIGAHGLLTRWPQENRIVPASGAG